MNNSHRERFQTIESFKAEFGIHITTGHTGKMTGFSSLSTSPLVNTFCQARSKCKGTICSHCYAMRMQKMYSELDRVLVKNHEVLTSRVIPADKWPILNVLMFRLESFGDVQNDTQLLNYLNFCKRNPRVQFTIWTKNPAIFKRVFAAVRKPKNLIVIISSPYVNKAANIKNYPFADKVFTVYEKEYAQARKIAINCGAHSCATCQRCYNRNDKTVYVNEILK